MTNLSGAARAAGSASGFAVTAEGHLLHVDSCQLTFNYTNGAVTSVDAFDGQNTYTRAYTYNADGTIATRSLWSLVS